MQQPTLLPVYRAVSPEQLSELIRQAQRDRNQAIAGFIKRGLQSLRARRDDKILGTPALR